MKYNIKPLRLLQVLFILGIFLIVALLFSRDGGSQLFALFYILPALGLFGFVIFIISLIKRKTLNAFDWVIFALTIPPLLFFVYLQCRMLLLNKAENKQPISPVTGEYVCDSHQGYENAQALSDEFTRNSCFNDRFKICAPASQTEVIPGTTNITETRKILGMEGNMCNVTYNITVRTIGKSGSMSAPQSTLWNCLFDPSQLMLTSASDIQKYCSNK